MVERFHQNKKMGLLKGNKLQARLNELGYETDNSDWDKSSRNDFDNDVDDESGCLDYEDRVLDEDDFPQEDVDYETRLILQGRGLEIERKW